MGRSKRFKVVLVSLVLVVAVSAWLVYENNLEEPNSSSTQTLENQKSDEVPRLKTEIIADGLSQPWDVALTSDGQMFFTEKSGAISTIEDGKPKQIAKLPDVISRGEGGLMGMTLDPDFAANRFLYACFYTGGDVRLARFKVNSDSSALTDRQDIITGMPAKDTGRHSGCRPRFGADNNLWIGTGDAALGTNPQDPRSLGGKILRVDRQGKGVAGNLEPPFDNRIYSYGHRNTQGLAMFKQASDGLYGYSVEHGPNRDDEVNELKQGNFGWDPVPGYNESVEMTDLDKFPNALRAVWRSGDLTIAPSGASMIYGSQWKAWDGALAMAVLKGRHVRILTFDEKGQLASEHEILNDFGRMRSVVQGPDGALYLTTDNRTDDKIIRITPL